MNSFQTLQTVIGRLIEIPSRQFARWSFLDKINSSKFTWFDRVTTYYLLLWFVLILWNYSKFSHGYVYLGFILLLIFTQWVIANFEFQTEIGKFLRYAYVMFYIIIFFSAQHFVIPVVNPNDVDALFIRIDYWMFGVHPTVWLEKFYQPWLVEYLQYAYTSYYFIPVIFGVLLYVKKALRELRISLLAICLGFYISYLGYLLFPALGPRFFLAHLHDKPLKGVFLFDAIQNLLNSLENIQYDAFPSGHTAIVIVVLFYAFHYARKLFWILLPIGISLIFSTVYLRYHYVIDVFGGIGVGIIAILITEWIRRYYGERFY